MKVSLFLLLFGCFIVSAQAQTASLTGAFNKLRGELISNKKTEVDEPYRKAMGALNTQYMTALDRLLASNTLKAGDVRQVMAEKNLIQSGGEMPPINFDGTLPVLQNLRLTYRRAQSQAEKAKEAARIKMRKMFDQRHGELMYDVLVGKLKEVPVKSEEMLAGIDIMYENLRIPIIGEWRVWTSKGVVETWKVEDKGKFLSHVITPKADCFLNAHAGGYHIVDYVAEIDWQIKITSQDVFEGNDAKDSRIKVHGIRIRP
jgi:hypothetical protein